MVFKGISAKKTLHFPHSILCLSVETLDIVRVHERPTSGTTSEYVPFAQHEPTRGARRPFGVCVKGTQNVVPTSDTRHADEIVARHVDDSSTLFAGTYCAPAWNARNCTNNES